MSKKRNRSLKIKAKAPELIDKKMREKGCRSQEQLAEKTGLSTKTLGKIFRLEQPGPERKTVEAIACVLELNPADIVEDWYPLANASEVEESVLEETIIKLRRRCRKMLEQQKRLTTNRIMARDGVTFDLDKVFVDLKIQNYQEDKTHGSNSKDALVFELKDFLENIIGNKQSPTSLGKRLAILGEAGCGKTTLLLK